MAKHGKRSMVRRCDINGTRKFTDQPCEECNEPGHVAPCCLTCCRACREDCAPSDRRASARESSRP